VRVPGCELGDVAAAEVEVGRRHLVGVVADADGHAVAVHVDAPAANRAAVEQHTRLAPGERQLDRCPADVRVLGRHFARRVTDVEVVTDTQSAPPTPAAHGTADQHRTGDLFTYAHLLDVAADLDDWWRHLARIVAVGLEVAVPEHAVLVASPAAQLLHRIDHAKAVLAGMEGRDLDTDVGLDRGHLVGFIAEIEDIAVPELTVLVAAPTPRALTREHQTVRKFGRGAGQDRSPRTIDVTAVETLAVPLVAGLYALPDEPIPAGRW
jgi:hypothetical protein